MPPIGYPDLAWSGRPSRLRRTLSVVAIAGCIGAIGGGAGVLAAMGLPGGSVRPQSAPVSKAPVLSSTRAATDTHSAPSQAAQEAPPPFASPQSSLAAALRRPKPSVHQQTLADVPKPASSFDQKRSAVPAASAKAASSASDVQHRVASAATHPALADQRSHPLRNGQAGPKDLYDRVEPAASALEASRQSVSTQAGRERTKSFGRRVYRPAIAEAPTAPVVIVPGRGYERGWRAERYYGDGQQSGRYHARDDYGRDAWRDRRPDDGDDPYDRDSGPSNPIGALFGFLGGGWR